jgi:hypothetical protein
MCSLAWPWPEGCRGESHKPLQVGSHPTTPRANAWPAKGVALLPTRGVRAVKQGVATCLALTSTIDRHKRTERVGRRACLATPRHTVLEPDNTGTENTPTKIQGGRAGAMVLLAFGWRCEMRSLCAARNAPQAGFHAPPPSACTTPAFPLWLTLTPFTAKRVQEFKG